MKFPLFALPVLGLLVGCGAPDDSTATATVTPDVATVKPGGKVTLIGALTGIGKREQPALGWWIEESRTLNSKNLCSKFDTDTSELTNCPFGYVVYHDPRTIPSNATYYAPQTPGTYHVVLSFGWLNMQWVERRATASITVVP